MVWPMSKTLGRFSILLLVFWVTGGQWLALQSVAWVTMVRDYSRNDSVRHAFSKTFDGNHPCPLCRAIQKQKSEESRNQKAASKVEKAELFFVVFADLRVTLQRVGPTCSTPQALHAWDPLPPSPPPKNA